MTQRELAARMNRPPQVINEIIGGKKSITSETAIGLETALGISATFWLNLESSFRLTIARNQEREALALYEGVLKEYPISEMIKRGWMQAGRDSASRLKALSGFLGTANPEPSAYQEAVGFRMTEAARDKVSVGALAAWLRQGEIVASQVETAQFDASRFERSLSPIRAMTALDPQDYLPIVVSLCAEAGVAFCLVPELPRSGANGVTRWLNDGKVIIQMSIRGKRADIFWFTFFHEACHVLRHKRQRLIILDGIGDNVETDDIESEANDFAADSLIRLEHWSLFENGSDFSQQSVTDFADSVGIAPGIVVGRLQKEGLVGFNELNHLRVSYEWE